jgi:hypothetical protein
MTANMNVLLIDNDRATRELLREVLQREGYTVGEATTGMGGRPGAAARDGASPPLMTKTYAPMARSDTASRPIHQRLRHAAARVRLG